MSDVTRAAERCRDLLTFNVADYENMPAECVADLITLARAYLAVEAERDALRAEVERLRAALADTVKAWVSEANLGDGIMEENGPILDAARAALAEPAR